MTSQAQRITSRKGGREKLCFLVQKAITTRRNIDPRWVGAVNSFIIWNVCTSQESETFDNTETSYSITILMISVSGSHHYVIIIPEFYPIQICQNPVQVYGIPEGLCYMYDTYYIKDPYCIHNAPHGLYGSPLSVAEGAPTPSSSPLPPPDAGLYFSPNFSPKAIAQLNNV